MAANFSQMKAALNEALERGLAARKRTQRALQELSTAKTEADGIVSTALNDMIADLDTRAANEPGNQAIQIMKAEKDELLADLVAMQAELAALNAAVGN